MNKFCLPSNCLAELLYYLIFSVSFRIKHWNRLTSWLAEGRQVSLPAVGRALYSLSLRKLSRASSTGTVSRILPLLLQAGCLADNRALQMSSVLYSTGLGVKKQPSKVCIELLDQLMLKFGVVVPHSCPCVWRRPGCSLCWQRKKMID